MSATDLQDDSVLSALAQIVDCRTGIVNRVVMEDPDAVGLEFPIVANAIPADAPGELERCRTMPVGWGKGFTTASAMIGAVGEAIERYSASLPDLYHIIWSRLAGLHGEVLDPRSFALYSEEQYQRPEFPFIRFDPEVCHPWVAGEWLGTGKPVWIPALLAYLYLEVSPEHVFCQGNSNGLAAGTNGSEAAVRAVLELIERDAFMASWRCKQPGERVQLDHALDPDLIQVVRGMQALGARIELYLLPSAGAYPTALCLGRGNGEDWPGATLGLGTDPDPLAAVRQAILELGQTGPYLRRLMKNKRCAVPQTVYQVKQMLDHATYYFPPERALAFDYLRQANTISLAQCSRRPERSLAACSQALATRGIRVALVDVTSSDIATTPFRVMRAISPDLQGISFGYGYDRESVPRLRNCRPTCENEIAPIW